MNRDETRLSNVFQAQGFEVMDMTDNKAFQVIDVDFVLTMKPFTNMLVECKSDGRAYSTGNFFVETVSNVETGRPGWLYGSKCDYLAYEDKIAQAVYIFTLADMKAYIEAHKALLRTVDVPDYAASGRVWKHSRGYLVPIRAFRLEYYCPVIDEKHPGSANWMNKAC